MKKQKHYFSLKIKGGNAFYDNGKRLRFTERIVNIGETADSDVRLETDSLPLEYYASIIKNEDGESWRIVKRYQHMDIIIAGKGTIGYACQLTDGDIIQLGDNAMTLCFHTHFDNHYDEDGEPTKTWPWTALAAICALCILAVMLFQEKEEKVICEEDVLPLQESVCLIKVDSVKQVLYVHDQENSVIRSKVLMGDAPTGTAFITTDGKLITARHCVEYWLGTDLDLTTKVESLPEDDIVKWAIETESYNQLCPVDADSMMQMKVWFSIYDIRGKMLYSYTSTDPNVRINREKDGLFQIADFDNDYYWRSIRPYFKNRLMSMGDILWIDGVTRKGKVKMATAKDMAAIKTGTKLMICGYPMTETGDKRMIPATGSIKSNPDIETENLFFESNINHGYSGGPVLIKTGKDIVAIGVVSCVDSISSGLFKWAVPVTEIKCNK